MCADIKKHIRLDIIIIIIIASIRQINKTKKRGGIAKFARYILIKYE